MPLNVPKSYEYTPVSSGETIINTKVSKRARAYAGGTFFRSRERGQQTNSIKVDLDENRTQHVGDLIVHFDAIRSSEMLISSDEIQLEIFSINLNWNQEIEIIGEGSAISRVRFIGIMGQISVGGLISEHGPFTMGSIIRLPNITFKLTGSLTAGTVTKIVPRVKRYPLTWTPKTIDVGGFPVTIYGWSIDRLRQAVNADLTGWIYMPRRPSGPGLTDGEDVTDNKVDADLLQTFSTIVLTGGDGLPLYPSGLSTGPDRTLIHLNYSEEDDGSLGVVNQIFEWNGKSSTDGFWDVYA
jgi:hypothetical protein